ncbi:MAG: hypothetical protein HC840_00370 [Leptolyngbyaceae cyanobacterium RM2_2_4]|nr:hypothetical protein [Leptolyngbyaceae cyanobacterium RM2_2_4]
MEFTIFLFAICCLIYIEKNTRIMRFLISMIVPTIMVVFAVFVGLIVAIPFLFVATFTVFMGCMLFLVRTPFYLLGGFLFEKNYLRFVSKGQEEIYNNFVGIPGDIKNLISSMKKKVP